MLNSKHIQLFQTNKKNNSQTSLSPINEIDKTKINRVRLSPSSLYDIVEDTLENDSYPITIQENATSSEDTAERKSETIGHIQPPATDKTTDNFLNDIADYYINSNSPISMSSSNSDDESFLIESEMLDNICQNKRVKYKRITYNEIENSLCNYYDKDNKYSNEMNIMSSYIKGQKHLYLQCQYITQLKQYIIIFTAITLSAIATIWSAVSPETKFAIVSLNATATTLIYMVNYMKYETIASLYLFIANNYDKLENSLTISSNKLFFMKNEEEQNSLILNKIRDVEFKIEEIKDIAKIHIPREMGKLFPIIMYVNIFSFIKKMEFHKKNVIIEYRDAKNEIRYILHKWGMKDMEMDESLRKIENNDSFLLGAHIEDETAKTNVPYKHTVEYAREKQRLTILTEKKEKLKQELLHHKDSYVELERTIVKEIKYAESVIAPFYPFLWFASSPSLTTNYRSTIVKDFLESIYM